MISAPLLAALGERPTILFFMRAAMLPLFAIVLICTYKLAARLYSQRIAWWSVILLSLWPSFFLKSLEYRTDNLWNAFWMVALVVLFSGPPSTRRWFFAGLLLGCAFAVSLKTTLLVVTLISAAVITRLVHRDHSRFAGAAIAAVTGFAIVPAGLAFYFASAGAWKSLVYCVFTFNTLLEQTRPPNTLEHVLWPFTIAAIVLIARRYPQSDPRRMFLGVAFALFLVTLFAFWILISPRDMLPIMPLGAIFAAVLFDRFDERVVVNAAVAAVLCVALFQYTDHFSNDTKHSITTLRHVLRLTRPGEQLMDLKGETIYRRRPFYFAFELIATEAIERGLILDRVPEAIVASRCYVATEDSWRFPTRARTFLNENFLDLGRLRAAGDWVDKDGVFTIAVPGPYVAINANQPAVGTMDGTPYAGVRELTAGDHKFVAANPKERVAIIWAPAVERGFSPFHLTDPHLRYKDHRRRSRRFQ